MAGPVRRNMPTGHQNGTQSAYVKINLEHVSRHADTADRDVWQCTLSAFEEFDKKTRRARQLPGRVHADLVRTARPWLVERDLDQLHRVGMRRYEVVRHNADTEARVRHPAHRVEARHPNTRADRTARFGGEPVDEILD